MPPQLVHQHKDAERIAEEQRHTVPSVLMIGEVQTHCTLCKDDWRSAKAHCTLCKDNWRSAKTQCILCTDDWRSAKTHCILCTDDWRSAKCQRHTAPFAASVRTHEGITDIMPELSRPTCCAAEQSNHRLHATQAPHSKSTQHKVTTRLHATEASHSKKYTEQSDHQTSCYRSSTLQKIHSTKWPPDFML